ncbi:MAG: OmpA family protein [Planctomycetaceae bacterium]|jgi:chemotaxis protein MotB|nr:OmpA family protein [Planctomycetaceae bacterium]
MSQINPDELDSKDSTLEILTSDQTASASASSSSSASSSLSSSASSASVQSTRFFVSSRAKKSSSMLLPSEELLVSRVVSLPDWVVIYGDMMALLLCFFVMLFSMSVFQKPQIQNAVSSLKSGFNNKSPNVGGDRNKISGGLPPISLTARSIQTTGDNTANQLATIQSVIIDAESIQGSLIRFDVGSDELTEVGKRELLVLVDRLRELDCRILICGHESASENGGIYRRELDLSYSRAITVYEFLVLHGLNRDLLQVIPLGQNSPINTEYNSVVEIKFITKQQ